MHGLHCIADSLHSYICRVVNIVQLIKAFKPVKEVVKGRETVRQQLLCGKSVVVHGLTLRACNHTPIRSIIQHILYSNPLKHEKNPIRSVSMATERLREKKWGMCCS